MAYDPSQLPQTVTAPGPTTPTLLIQFDPALGVFKFVQAPVSDVLSGVAGIPGGVASLDGTGKVPSAQLPGSAGGIAIGIIAAGTGQASATLIAAQINVVATVNAGGGALVLPASGIGIAIYNDATLPCPVFPADGAAINGNPVNQEQTIAIGGVATFDVLSSTLVRSR